jgi:peroxiredoxin
LRRDNSLAFPVLSDIDLGFALTTGLVMWIGEELQKLYPEAGVDLALFHGNRGGFLPIPATFVVGKDGLIKARYVDPDFRRRMAVEDILTALASIREPEPIGSRRR